ncbi:esterase [Curvibacter sp. APW13]|uniref:esterase n=1 Tax=Curvibacter sp. APW13 TaxID=3077236 RepID=UPI0028DE5BBC|nr:esterase [Curvibacter sp. APW13]MDT8991942.1 esterase [Curvibacter sp. APW13]
MTENSMDLAALVVQRPEQAAQLVLLFHGEFTDAQAMVPCAQALAAVFPQALVACIQAPHAATGSDARQWLGPVPAGDEAAWQTEVQQALPRFQRAIAWWQTQTGVASDATALVGFGQGATLVLESTQCAPAPASRVVAIAGRFANLPEDDRYRGTIHFLHGKNDSTVSYHHTIAGAYRVRDLGLDLTAEVVPFIGHELHADFIEATVEKLSQHISKHLWDDALAARQDPPTPH